MTVYLKYKLTDINSDGPTNSFKNDSNAFPLFDKLNKHVCDMLLFEEKTLKWKDHFTIKITNFIKFFVL